MQCLSSDSDFAGRVSAAELLGVVATRGSLSAVEALLRRLHQDPDGGVRAAAAKSLGEVAAPGDGRAVAGLAQCMLSDTDFYARRAAVAALGKVAQRGDSAATKAFVQCLEKELSRGVRERAVEMLAEVAASNDGLAVSALVDRLKDSDGAVRRSAAIALRSVSDRGDDKVIAALRCCLDDHHPHRPVFAEAAAETLQRLADDAKVSPPPPTIPASSPGTRASLRPPASLRRGLLRACSGLGASGAALRLEILEELLKTLVGPCAAKKALADFSVHLARPPGEPEADVDVDSFLSWLYA